MDTDRPSTLNHAEQSPNCSPVWSTRSDITLSTLSASQIHRTSNGYHFGQPSGIITSWSPRFNRLATNSALHTTQAGNHHRLPRFLHNFLDIFRGECSADQSRTDKARSLQHAPSSHRWTLPFYARNLDWQPALSLLKKTPESPKIDGEEDVEQDEEEKREPRRFFCKNCKQWIAFVSDTIQVDDIPTLTLQINPHGFVHEVITVKYIVNCLIAGPPVPADTWFPGYVWRFLICQQCRSHLGWSYHQPKETSMSFAGLRKASIIEE